ncbi:PAS domain S-box protein [Pseudanabaena sp. BC1403]|uniref:PAS domain-containing hybrid sensor histidine kinase/response regulator n=1 Tax=Pseudanabaena sp. BC1403 TaxID=2043171 RepID=UPI000CD8B98D|nr:PAS domain S-box protein [Pseudanabaena sp. BC1403]
MFLSNKIVYGYAIALCITSLGTASGLLLGNYYHQEALQKSQTISQEHQSLNALQLDVLYNRPAKQLSSYVKEDPQDFRRESAKFLESIQTTLTILENHTASGKLSKIEGIEPLINEHKVFLREFKQESQDLIARLDRLIASPKALTEAESQLVKFFKSKKFLRFIEFPNRLSSFAQTIYKYEKEAGDELSQAKELRLQISITSFLISVAIAAWFIRFISRAIAIEQANDKQKLQDQLIERQQTEAKLLKSESHQRAILSALPDMIIRINREGFYSEFIASPSFPMLGIAADLVGTNLSETLPPDVVQQRMEYIQLTLQTNSIQIYEQTLFVNGREQVEEVRIVPYSEDEVLLLVRDISEQYFAQRDRQQAEIALAASEAKSRAILSMIPELMFRVGRDLVYREFISQPKDFEMALQNVNITGRSMLEMLPADIAERHISYLQRALQTGELQFYEQKIQDGDRFYYEEVRVIKINEDEVLFMIRDISDRKQAELALAKSEAHSKAMLSAIPDLMLRVGADGVYREFVTQNRGFAIDTPKIDRAGQSMLDVLPEAIVERQFYYLQKAIETGGLQVYEQQVQVADRLIYEEVRVVKSGEDEVLFMIRDISDRKQTELALGKELRRSEMLFNTSLDGLLVLDIEGKIIEANQSFADMLGYSLEEVMALRIYDIDTRWTPEELNKGVHEFGQDKRVKFETLHRRKDGSLCTVEIAASSVSWADEIVQFAICRDISARKQAELELLQLNQSLESKVRERTAELQQTNEELICATRLKDEFLANMSHELRTPLNAILGMTEGLQEQVYGDLNERQLKALETVERSGSHLLELINDILDLAKIEAGQIELDCTPTSISHLCQSSLSFIRQHALQKGIQLEVKTPLNLPSLVVDERRIRQVLINLLNNAVKFTPKGGRVNLEVAQLPPDVDTSDRSSLQYLRISVIDTGIGISPENIKKLFQPFIQIDSALNRQYEGTGLGLALVKRIIELHNGRVGLTSELGVGSCFTVDLPHDFASDIVVRKQPETTLLLDAPITNENDDQFPLILLVEDNEANIITIVSYLEAKQYRVLLAKNGQDAIAIAKAHQPDIILMDIQMPVMDGIEAIRQIRLDPNLINIPIIAMTALAMSGDRDRCLEAGANDYLSKPLKLKQLVTMIQIHVDRLKRE